METKRLYCMSLKDPAAADVHIEGRRKGTQKGYEEIVWAYSAREMRETLASAITDHIQNGWRLIDRDHRSAVLTKESA